MNILLQQMLSHADPSQVAGLARFFKTGPGQYGEGDKFLGIKVPVTRAVVKECWRQVGLPELEDCIASEYHEVRLASLLTLVEIFKHAGKRSPAATALSTPAATPTPGAPSLAPPAISTAPALAPAPAAPTAALASPIATSPSPVALSRAACVDFYLSHTDRINNWDLVDLSCYPLLGEWLLDRDRTLLYDLACDGRTIWEQRIGIVSTMTFIRHGQLADTFAIADILLHHPHDLIHKAVGWLLREAGKRDKAALEKYLKGADPTAAAPTTASPTPARHTATGTSATPSAPACCGPSSPRYLSMPRTMLRYAIEKFPEAERQEYLSGKVR